MAVRALVTGATGFVGSRVARLLLERGFEVRVLVRPASDLSNIAGLDIERLTGDLRDRASLARALEGMDVLFHVAADYRLWVPRPKEIYESNVAGTENILQAAIEQGVERVVYTSSVATLGLREDGPADESTPVSYSQMIGHYKRSKYLAEERARQAAKVHGLDVVIVNPSTPVGPGDIRPTPTGRMILDAASGKMPAYVDTGLNIVHVDDVAQGHLLALERGKRAERYILGGENMHLSEILREIALYVGRRPPRIRLPHNLILPVAYGAQMIARLTGKEPLVTVDGVRLAKKKMFFSSRKAEDELGYRTRPARLAIREAVDWFRERGML